MSTKSRRIPVALTIAGSDSGGGAGIQADLKTFASLEVHGTCAITCITAQDPRSVHRIEACSVSLLQAQLDAVFDELGPAAAKTGMLYSAEIIGTVAKYFRSRSAPALVVDPVMVATSGSSLFQPIALARLCRELLPLATLVTPNLAETEALLGKKIEGVEDLRAAARELQQRFGCAALVKGGHLRDLRQAVDFFFDGKEELLLSAPFIRQVHTHGTGCTYSAAIVAYLARRWALPQAVAKGKEYITQAIAHSQTVGRHSVLNSFWQESGGPGRFAADR